MKYLYYFFIHLKEHKNRIKDDKIKAVKKTNIDESNNSSKRETNQGENYVFLLINGKKLSAKMKI